MQTPYRWIKWEPYPKKKPTKPDDYLVTLKINDKKIVRLRFFNGTEFYLDNHRILAFSENPAPYQGEPDDIELI